MTAAIKPAGITLYTIASEIEAVAEELIANGGELTPELETRLTAGEGAFAQKVEKIALHIRNLQAFASGATSEAARLSGLATARENAIKALKRYVLEQMERVGQEKVETALVKARIQKNPISIRWPGEPKDIPEPYRRLAYALDGELARDHHKAGKLPSVFVVEQGRHLRLS